MSDALTPLFFGVAILAVTAARSLWLRLSSGANPYAIDHGDPLHRFVAHVFIVVVAGLFGYFSGLAIWPAAEPYFGQVGLIAGDTARGLGVLLMAAGTIWTAYSQFAMGDSWRIGIPDEAPALRTSGPFAVSRNPVFLGMLTVAAGMTLWSPSAATIALLAAAYVAVEVQIRGEEAFLERTHGDAYRAYRAHVRRWI
jgi:protein-S-isoprenylcysteine O-methyltransferase Ste14